MSAGAELVSELLAPFTSESLLLELLWRFAVLLILAASLDLAVGSTGLFQLGHIGFFALGALGTTFGTHPEHLGLDAFAGILLGFAFTTVAIFIVGLPTLRLTGDYFAIATMGFGIIVQVAMLGYYANGVAGVPSFNPAGCDLACMHEAAPWMGEGRLGTARIELLIVGAISAVSYLLLGRIKASPFGRVLRAIREDRHAASALGKNVPALRFGALWMSALFASLAGSLWVHHFQIMSPRGYDFLLMVLVLVMVILGGLGNHQGAFVGAAIALLLNEETVRLTSWLGTVAPDATSGLDLPALRNVLFAVMLLLLMLLRPQGILGSRRLQWPARWRRALRREGGSP